MTSEEFVSAIEFQEELGRLARSHRLPNVEDPLGKLVTEIEGSPAFAQSRLLTRVLVALAEQQGAFRRADLTLLTTGSLGTVNSLLDGHAAGRITLEDCKRAASRASAAQRSAEA